MGDDVGEVCACCEDDVVVRAEYDARERFEEERDDYLYDQWKDEGK